MSQGWHKINERIVGGWPSVYACPMLYACMVLDKELSHNRVNHCSDYVLYMDSICHGKAMCVLLLCQSFFFIKSPELSMLKMQFAQPIILIILLLITFSSKMCKCELESSKTLWSTIIYMHCNQNPITLMVAICSWNG